MEVKLHIQSKPYTNTLMYRTYREPTVNPKKIHPSHTHSPLYLRFCRRHPIIFHIETLEQIRPQHDRGRRLPRNFHGFSLVLQLIHRDKKRRPGLDRLRNYIEESSLFHGNILFPCNTAYIRENQLVFTNR